MTDELPSRFARRAALARRRRLSARLLEPEPASGTSESNETAPLVTPAPPIDLRSLLKPGEFDENAYLFFNPDVAAATRYGLPGGRGHWNHQGRREGRGGAPLPDLGPAHTAQNIARHEPGINLYGFLSATGGMGGSARGLRQALAASTVQHRSFDVPPWADSSASRALPEPAPFRVNLLQQNADHLPPFVSAYGEARLADRYNIGYWVWELPSVRPDWFHLYAYLDELWVPSEFCREAFACATRLPVRVVPHVVDGLDTIATHNREYFGFPPDVFVFGCIFDVSSYMERKNPIAVVRAFRAEFGDSDRVCLYLKFSNRAADRFNLRVLEESIQGASNIKICEATFNESENASLHRALDCLVSAHRAEGFGLNLAESMYFGRPVIATAYSANTGYMDVTNSYPVDYTLVPLTRTTGPYRKHNVWADPSVASLQRQMRRVFEERAEREAIGSRASATIRSRFSAQAVATCIEERLREVGLNDPAFSRATLSRHSAYPTLPRLVHPSTPRAVVREVSDWLKPPVISVITPVFNVPGPYLQAAIESVRSQHYPYWELILCNDASSRPDTLAVLNAYQALDPRIRIVHCTTNGGIAAASNRAAEFTTGSYLAMLDHDDELTPDCLLEVARALRADPTIGMLYTDECRITADGRAFDHYCKPDWSPEHLHSVMYLLHLLVVRKDLFFLVDGFRARYSGAQDYDLALRLSRTATRIHHVPKMLYRWRMIPGSAASSVTAKPKALEAGREALADHIWTLGLDAQVEPGRAAGLFRVRHRIAGTPPVSLLILTGDRSRDVPGRGPINLVSHFARSIAATTTYLNYEIVIVDDGQLTQATRIALRDVPHRIASFTAGPSFNFSRKANFAFTQADTELVVLLNDDMEVIAPGWLEALLEYAQQPEVGAVGARLLFLNERIQHAGVVIGVNEGAAHVYHNAPASQIGYNAFTDLVRNYAAVTGACLATRKSVIERLGGFEEDLAVDYNDIDFCLRAIESGLRVVYTPFAELYHFEGSSAPRTTQSRRESAWFRQRWARYIAADPYYNPNLTRRRLDFSLREGVRLP